MMRFASRLVAESAQMSWAALQAGEFMTDAALRCPGLNHSAVVW